jgi:tRNA(Ile2)-agmatinylcytidine synthase
VQFHIGIDDTDSNKGGCTTYIAARLVEKLDRIGVTFIDHPNIIRLNPNIPYKTRGNAAVALRFEAKNSTHNSIVETILEEIEENSHFGQKGTEPAVVILRGRPSSAIKRFSRRALSEVVSESVAMRSLRSSRACAAAYGGTLGFVGALAAVGQTLESDHTYELIAYRRRRNWGTPRRVDEVSVKRMDKLTTPKTFNNYDFENRRMLVTPHGPDPVLLGIRGETSEIVLKAFRMLTIKEPIERWVIFRTNHGTDAHLQNIKTGDGVKLNTPIVLRGIVADRPRTIRGGHVFFTMNYKDGLIRCAAFEPTGKFRNAAAKLLQGDDITAFGGVRTHDNDTQFTINLEKMFVHRTVEQAWLENPACPSCGKHMKSAGREQGFRCKRCSLAISEAQKRITKVTRSLRPGLYIPVAKAHRHLTKPLSRYGFERIWNHKVPSGIWHEP